MAGTEKLSDVRPERIRRVPGLVWSLLGMAGRGILCLLVLNSLGAWPTPLGAQHPGWGTTPFEALKRSDGTRASSTERTFQLLLLAKQADTLTGLERAQERFAFGQYAGQGDSSPELSWARPAARLWINTGGSNRDVDGPVWQGKGTTVAASAGVIGRVGALHFAVRPLAYATENGSFFSEAGVDAPNGYRDPSWGSAIDLPVRLGDGVRAFIDPGESYVALRAYSLTFGASSTTQRWGPAHRFPLVLSGESGGIPRVFLEGTNVPLRIGRASATWFMGGLEASTESGLEPGARSRVATAFMGSFVPSAMPALEVGGSRFFHLRRARGTFSWSSATWPFSGIQKSASRDEAVGGANQLGSVFARVSPLGSGVEVYGEYYREDHNVVTRDVAAEPDHISAYVLGLRRAWVSNSDISAVTIERANGRISHLARVREQGPIYVHSSITEGHTFRGQALGSSDLIGGGGTSVMWDLVGPRRSIHVVGEVLSARQNGEGGAWNGRVGGLLVLGVGSQWTHGGRRLGAMVIGRRGYGDRRGMFFTINALLR